MSKFLFVIILTLFSISLLAQDATLPTPEASPNGTKLRVIEYSVNHAFNTAYVRLAVTNNTGDVITRHIEPIQIVDLVETDPLNEYRRFITSLITVKAGETGNAERRAQFRIISYLKDFDPNYANITVNP